MRFDLFEGDVLADERPFRLEFTDISRRRTSGFRGVYQASRYTRSRVRQAYHRARVAGLSPLGARSVMTATLNLTGFRPERKVAAPVVADGERLAPEVEQLVVTSGLARTGVTTLNAGAA